MLAPTLVEVSVRDAGGAPLGTGAIVRLYARVGSYNRIATTRDAATASFADVIPGEYEIEAQAAGYQTTTEHASVMGGGLRATFYVFMRPENDASRASAPPGPPIMAPKLQKEIQKALQKLIKHEYEEALRDLQKAEKKAPGNPDMHYLMGMANSGLGRADAARAEFETALSIDPSHVRSLQALGELQLRSGQTAMAVKTLERAYQLDGADWRTHFVLAIAYFDDKQYEKAEKHVGRALELHKGKPAEGRLLLARILLARGRKQEAKSEFERVAQEFPEDPAATTARQQLAELNKPIPAPAPESAGVAAPIPIAPAVPAVVKPWAPPDIDSKEYALASDVACAEPEVLARAQARMKQQLENFEKFTATEHIVHVEVDNQGIPGNPREKDFSYMVTLWRPSNGITYLEESRDGGENLDQFPTSLATKGLVSIGVAVLDRNYEGDFNYRCEGLTKWRGEPAWEMRFEQRKEIPSRLYVWKNIHGAFPIPLRGRIWVGANTYNLLHLESDLREPVLPLELTMDHLVIDYGPVHFDKSGTDLWLPWHADTYLQVRGKRYHHSHTLTNYILFSVDTKTKVSAPKEGPEEQH
jgi:Flp pilus assembly protein TadD